jgi:hypothetical protein
VVGGGVRKSKKKNFDKNYKILLKIPPKGKKTPGYVGKFKRKKAK